MTLIDVPATTAPHATPALHRPFELRRRPSRLAKRLTAANRRLRVVQLCFEGPDGYSAAGGLGVRVWSMAEALAAAGVATDLYFVGDPALPPVERRKGVTLRRWCQAISSSAPAGVYDAEEDKIADLCAWWPAHVADRIAIDAELGIRTVVLAEDWHTAWPLIGLHDELVRRGARQAATLAWTANNRFGFDRIDFGRLSGAATVITISRAMKHLMWGYGVNPAVVPNGIPDAALTPVDAITSRVWDESFEGVTTLAKIGRWDPDKRWHMAIDAVAALRARGERSVLLARGWNGSPAAAAHAHELRAHAAGLGLDWVRLEASGDDGADLARTLRRVLPAGSGVVELAFPIAGSTLQAFYAGSDVVLANSGFEPFGLVGLEAMAAGALVVTGSTGEDYVDPFRNGFALDTDDAREIVRAIDWMRRDPARSARLRSAALATAKRYRWTDVIERLWIALDLDPAHEPST